MAGTAVYQVDFFYKGESAGNNQRFFAAVIGSYKITAPKTAAVDDAAASMPIYNGIPIDTVIGMSADDVTDTFGEPNFGYENFIEIPISNEDASMSVQMDDTKHVIMFGAIAKKFELNGRNLNQGYDGLVETFGRKPDARQESDLLELRWYYDGCSILIGLDSDGLPGKAEVWKKMKKKEAAQCVFTWIDNNALTEVFDYEYVDEGTLNGSGMEVYNFQLLDRDGRQIPVSVEKDTGELWAVPDDGNVQVLYEYYANNYGHADDGNETVSGSLPNGFVWVEQPTGKTDDVGTIINGIAQNTSDKTYSHVSISFNLYDSSGNQVDTTSTKFL